MHIGILGTGFGAYHARLYKNHPLVESITIFGRNEEKLRKLRSDLGIKTVLNIDDILCDPRIGLVDICLPSELHCAYILKALEMGKNVFCETKMCETREEAEIIINAEHRYHKNVFVDLFIKFDPAYRFLYEVIRNNTYGKLKTIELYRKTAPVWGDLGIGCIVTNLMIHEIDFLLWTLGDPTRIFALGADGGKTSGVTALLSFPFAAAVCPARP